MASTNNNGNGPLYAMVGLILGLTAIVGAVVGFGNNPANVDRLISFIGTTLSLVIASGFLAKKVTNVQDSANTNTERIMGIEKRVNGQLDAKFQQVHTHIDEVVIPAVATPLDLTPNPNSVPTTTASVLDSDVA